MATKRTHGKKQAESKKTGEKTGKKRLELFCCLFLVLGTFIAALSLLGNHVGKLSQKDGFYEIRSKEDYRRFWEMVYKRSDCNGRLMCDITLNDWTDLKNWREKPPENVSIEVEVFSGIFDGNGYTIYGLYSENGYGLVKDNLGTIENLTIKNSMITGKHPDQKGLQGSYYNSGICYRNYCQIQNCRFEGVLCNREYHSARAAGICIINYGKIKQCVYNGVMRYIWRYWVYSNRAGICTENRGKVKNCCNLSEERVWDKGYYTEKPEDCFAYPIADEGMENCYVAEDSFWGMLKKEPVIALAEDQMYALPWLLEENFYPLLEKEMELPFADGRFFADEPDGDVPKSFETDNEKQNWGVYDVSVPVDKLNGSMLDIYNPNDYKFGQLQGIYKNPMVTRMIRLLAEHEDGILADIELKEIAKRQPGSIFAAKLSVKDQAVRIEAYPVDTLGLEIESVLEMIDDGNYEGLWKGCGDILGQEGIKTWQHKTYQLTKLPDRIGSHLYMLTEISGQETLVRYQAERLNGFFYMTENVLYRVEMSIEISMEMSEQELQKEELLTERLLKYLTEGWQLSDGISWEDKKIQKAVYTTLWEGGAGKDFGDPMSWKEAVFSNEDITGLKELTVNEVGNGESYYDLQFLRELRSLRLCGKGEYRKLRLYFPEESLLKLEELAIENCRLGQSLQSVEDLPALTKLRLDECFVDYHRDLSRISWVQDLLRGCKNLKELSLRADGITAVSELAMLTELEKLDLSFNEIKDFSPLYDLKNLKSLAVNDNPGKELGELVYVPDLWAGSLLENTEEMAQAQQVMNAYSRDIQDQAKIRFLYGVQVQNQARGDLNGDGIEDLAVIGTGWENNGKNGTGGYLLDRKIYLFLGTEQGFDQVQTIQLPKSVEERVGVTEDNPFSGVAISGNHLIIRIWTDKQDLAVGGAWNSTSIYTWADDKLVPECRNETEYKAEAEYKTEAAYRIGTEYDLWQKNFGKMEEAVSGEIGWKDKTVKQIIYREIGEDADDLSEDEMEQALGEIKELYIYQFDKVSTLEDLRKLPNLESLTLFGEKKDCEELGLTGELVPNLKELFISNVGIEDVNFLEKLPPLTRLYITMCNLRDISAVGYQEELTEVSFYGNQIKNIWPLRKCKKIEKLTLTNNWIEDISMLASLENLYAVELSGNLIRNIEVLQWLPKLKSLSLERNQIQDISVLQDLEELQFLWLSDNLIEDFQPVLGLKGLLSFSAGRNPGQNIGNLLFVPNFSLDGGFYEREYVEKEEAQEYLDSFYAEEKLVAEDMVKGDLNGDGILDVAVVGRTRFPEEESEDSSENTFRDIERAVYVFLGRKNGNSRALPPIETDGPYNGGPFGDPYQGIMITEGRLTVQTYGGSSWRWGYTNVYEYENGVMAQKWELCREHSTFAGGNDFTVKNMENGHMWYYVIAGDWEEETQRQLLLAEYYDEAYENAAGNGIKAQYGNPAYAVVDQINRKWKKLSEKSGIVTPPLYAGVFQPEICEEYYDYRLHSTFYDTKEQPERILDMAAEQFLKSENQITGECYPTEEIKDNFELLVGVELPSYFYMGYSRKRVPCILCYDGCQQNEDGSYVHRLALVTSDGEFWQQKEIISYEETEGIFVVG